MGCRGDGICFNVRVTWVSVQALTLISVMILALLKLQFSNCMGTLTQTLPQSGHVLGQMSIDMAYGIYSPQLPCGEA